MARARLTAVAFLSLLLAACSKPPELVICAAPGAFGTFWASGSGGGLAVLKNAAAAEKRPHLLLGGDGWFVGTAEGARDKGLEGARLMSAVGYDAVLAGPDEFTYGWRNLQYIIQSSTLPALGSNVSIRGSGQFLLPSMVKDFGAFRVGVMGLLADEQHRRGAQGAAAPSLPVKNELERTRELVGELKRKGVEFVVALLAGDRQETPAMSRQRAAELAAAVPELSLVLVFNRLAVEAETVRSGQSWLAVCPHLPGTAFNLTLSLNPASHGVRNVSVRSQRLDPAVFGEDSGIAAAVAALRAETEKKLGRRVTFAQEELSAEPLGNWAADCLLRWGKGQAAFLNRGALWSSVPAGVVSEKTLYELCPQDDTVMLVKIRGAELRQALEHSLDAPELPLFASGLQVSYNPQGDSGARVRSVSIDGAPLSDAKLYKIIATDYMLAGGEGCSGLSQAVEFANTHEPVRKILRWCMAKNRTLSAPKDVRWLKEP